VNKTNYIFAALALLTISIFTFVGVPSLGWQIGVSATLIAVFGIPHGAIDHIIFMKDRQVRPITFYAFYLGMMSLYLVLWLVFPQASFVVFLLISAFHFGQSQFSEVHFKAELSAKLLYFFWGVSILSGMVVYHMPQLSEMMVANPDKLPVFAFLQDYNIFNTVFIGSTIVTNALFVWSAFAGDMPLKRLVMEVIIFGLIHLCFYTLPMLVGFTVYFAGMHSLKVLSEEFSYLKQSEQKFNTWAFVKLLMPYTALSLMGIGITLWLAQLGIIQVNSLLLALIFISILTLPHSFVMHSFYKKIYPQKAIGTI